MIESILTAPTLFSVAVVSFLVCLAVVALGSIAMSVASLPDSGEDAEDGDEGLYDSSRRLVLLAVPGAGLSLLLVSLMLAVSVGPPTG